jgi:hypothetical protein
MAEVATGSKINYIVDFKVVSVGFHALNKALFSLAFDFTVFETSCPKRIGSRTIPALR